MNKENIIYLICSFLISGGIGMNVSPGYGLGAFSITLGLSGFLWLLCNMKWEE